MAYTLRSLTIALLGLACLALAVAPHAHAAKGMEVALEDDPVFVNQYYYDRKRALQQAQQLGVSRIRVNLGVAPRL